MTLAERIASEIMDTIERERRVNKDDIVATVERVLIRALGDSLARKRHHIAS